MNVVQESTERRENFHPLRSDFSSASSSSSWVRGHRRTTEEMVLSDSLPPQSIFFSLSLPTALCCVLLWDVCIEMFVYVTCRAGEPIRYGTCMGEGGRDVRQTRIAVVVCLSLLRYFQSFRVLGYRSHTQVLIQACTRVRLRSRQVLSFSLYSQRSVCGSFSSQSTFEGVGCTDTPGLCMQYRPLRYSSQDIHTMQAQERDFLEALTCSPCRYLCACLGSKRS